jgi:hypothetical protein
VVVPRAAKFASLVASAKTAKTMRELRNDCLPTEDGHLRGAMIAWIPGIRALPLEKGPLFTAWGEWLSIEPPERSVELHVSPAMQKRIREARLLAPQVSDLIAFDHVIGNWDRWSGHNILVDTTRSRVVFLDHNLAFDVKIDPRMEAARTRVLHRVQRFSRALIAGLRGLTRDELLTTLGKDDLDAPLLDAPRVEATLRRRDELIAWVDQLIEHYGETRVLSFD